MTDEFHKHEVIDRTHTIQVMVEELLANHHVVWHDPILKAKVEEVQSKLYEIYNYFD